MSGSRARHPPTLGEGVTLDWRNLRQRIVDTYFSLAPSAPNEFNNRESHAKEFYEYTIQSHTDCASSKAGIIRSEHVDKIE